MAPFFDSAYSGGGFTLGLGYMHFVSPYNQIDVRGSYTALGYKRVEAEFIAPRLFHRRGELTVLGGWREATQARFYGIGMDTSKDDRTNYDFQQPYGSASLTLWPTRRLWMLRGGARAVRSGRRGRARATFPSVETVYTPATLPGLGAKVTYVHTQGTVGVRLAHRRRAMPGAAGSTASRCTTTPTAMSNSASGRSTTR